MHISTLKYTVLLLSLFASTYLSGQVDAQFSAFPVSGCSPLVVHFTDQSTGNITDWHWKFSNGVTSDTANPTVTFVIPGFYDVTLIVTDGTSTDSVKFTNYIHVFQKPTAAFKGTPLAGCAPLTVQFTDQSVKGSGNITGWLWDLGDGGTSTLQNPVHTYTSGGNFTVSLVVTDANTCNNDLIITAYIKIPPIPVANFSANSIVACTIPHTVNFNYTGTGGFASLIWDFGDGQTSTTTQPFINHTYTQFGTYHVSVVVITASGCTDTLLNNNFVTLAPFSGNLHVSKNSACPGEMLQFSGNALPAGLSYTWNFGDNLTSNKQNPTHSYAQPGVFTVQMIANGAICKDTLDTLIYISQPIVNFGADPLFGCSLPHTVQFTDSTLGGIATWLWDFGDGSTSAQSNPQNVYHANGIFAVSLTATDTNGCIHTDTALSVEVDTLEARATASPQEGCIPLNVDFFNLTNTRDSITSTLWTFGTGDSATGIIANYTFTDTGVFVVKMITQTATGCIDSTTVVIGAGIPPSATFGVDDSIICAENAALFLPDSVIYANGFTYFYGDGKIGSAPSHFYMDTGYFSVTMIPNHYGCPGDTIIKDSAVYVLGPVAGAAVDSFDCSRPLRRRFANLTIDANRYKWYFGDGDSSTATAPVHLYPARGNYAAALIAYNDTNECQYTAPLDIAITVPIANIVASDTIACQELLNVSFDGSASQDAVLEYYNWDFGNGQTYNKGNEPDITKLPYPDSINYTGPGQYMAKLLVRDVHLCQNILAIPINVLRHETRIFTPDQHVCLGSPVAFFDSSLTDTPIISRNWNFGDNSMSSDPHPVHTYSTAGTYAVTLQTTDSFGCMDMDTIQVVVHDPKFNFSANPVKICHGDDATFTPTLQNPAYSYFWDFGDGQTDTTMKPVHAYQVNGFYNITLIGIDSLGCRDTVKKNQYLEVQGPIAQFAVSDSTTNCPPLLVNFTDQSQGSNLTYLWSFGDGSSSTVQNPAHNYLLPGVFDIQLTVTSSAGCSDSIMKSNLIRVMGPTAAYSIHPDSGCPPLAVQFIADSLVNVQSILWDFGDGFTSSNDTAVHIYPNGGTYYPTLVISNGLCEYAIAVPDPIVVDTIRAQFTLLNHVLCRGDTAWILNTSIGSGLSYEWLIDGVTYSGFEPPPIFTFSEDSIIVRLIAENVRGCRDTLIDVFPIYEIPDPGIYRDTAICLGDEIILHAPELPGATYQWVPETGLERPEHATTPASPAKDVYYMVVVTSAEGCTAVSGSFEVKVFQPLSIYSSDDTVIYAGDTAQLHTFPDDTISGLIWTPSASLSCSECLSPLAFPFITTSYTVMATDTSGCFKASAGVLVEVLDEVIIVLPDLFTPNGDGVNDFIYAEGRMAELLELRIYDRWGTLVFESNNKEDGWDGTYRNKPQPADSYAWYARARSYSGEEVTAKGVFTLVR